MNEKNFNLKKAVLTAAIALMTTAGALAQLNWSGNITLNNGDVINENITMSGGVYVDVPAGEATINGVLSGQATLYKKGAGTLRLSANNTYSYNDVWEPRDTWIQGGKLILGNGGNSGSVIGSIVNGGTLVLDRSDDFSFTNDLIGSGNLYKEGSGKLIITNAFNLPVSINIFAGVLQIGNGGTSGSMENNIVLENANTGVIFYRSDNYTYSNVISGQGGVSKLGLGRLTFDGINTYTGLTEIEAGTFVLSSTGSIESSSELNIHNGNFEIEGYKIIKNLNSNPSHGNINIGDNTLQIGTSNGSNGNGGIFGELIGTGTINKYGSGTFTIGTQAAAIQFSLLQGAATMSGTWAGTLRQSSGTTLTVIRNVRIGGNLSLLGGTIAMNINTSPPAQINVTGSVSTFGTTTLNLSPAVTPANQVLIQAASGLGDASAFALNMPGGTASLNATGTQLLLAALGRPPRIAEDPKDVTITAGQSATFTVVANGTPAPTYQWQSRAGNSGSWNDLSDGTPNGITYEGTKTTTLTLKNVREGYNGSQYRCVVTNTAGSGESNFATLTVNYPPKFNTLPSDATVTEGQYVAFIAEADGRPAPDYRWIVSTNGGGSWSEVNDDKVYSGATTSKLMIAETPVTFDGYQYRCVATNSAGSDRTGVVTLKVKAVVSAPSITSPANSTITAGSDASFTVTVSGTPAPTVQWQELATGDRSWRTITNGGIYSGATTTKLTLSRVSLAFNGYQYRCVATNTEGKAESNAATLTVTAPNHAPTINTPPANSAITVGTGTSFTVIANGSPSPTFQWQVSTNGGGSWSDITNDGGGIYSDFTTATLKLNNVPITFNGYQYRCVATNAAGNATSTEATLTVTEAASAPTNITPPANSAITAGAGTSFTVTANGSPSPTFQWQVSTDGGGSWSDITNDGGGIYSDFTTATLKLNNVPITFNGYQYKCVATNTAGNITSTEATLTVTEAVSAPTIITSPANSAIIAGAGTSFTFTASGSPSPTFQWQVSTDGGGSWSDITNDGGGIYSNFTTATLKLNNVPITFNGYQYRCVATNTAGNITSTDATLMVTENVVYVTNIIGVPTEATAGMPLILTATVAPANATQQNIVWSVSNARTTGATISGTTFVATAAGTATVTATIAGGASGGAYTQTFEITVSPPTATEVINATTPLRAWMVNGLLHVTGLTPGEPLSIYSMIGILCHHSITSAPESDIRISAPGVYIVISGERQIRTIVK